MKTESDKRVNIQAHQRMLSKEDTFFVDVTQKYIKVSKKTTEGFIHSLKLHFSKRKINMLDFLTGDRINCGFCGVHNSQWYPNFYIDENKTIYLTTISYKNPIRYCFINKSECPGKKLNSNSVKFTSVAYNISEEDALTKIHERNKSPFYRKNHDSYEDYIKFQSTRLSGKTEEEMEELRAYLRYTHSVDYYIVEYGPAEGYRKWNEITKSQAITPEKMKQKWGEDLWEEKYNHWKKTCVNSRENFIKRHGEKGEEKFNEYFNYGINTYTEQGDLLKSNFEIKFYEKSKTVGLLNEQHFINKRYPNSIKSYDFYFPELDLYIELAGNMKNEEYRNKIIQKQEEFDCLVLIPEDIPCFDFICKEILQQIKDKQNERV